MAEYFHMGGYAGFVWTAYGVALVLMLGLVVVSLIQFRRARRLVEDFEKTEAARPRRQAMPMTGSSPDGTSA